MKSGLFSPDGFMSGLYGELYTDPYKNAESADEARAVSDEIKRRARTLFNLEKIPKDERYLEMEKIGRRLVYPGYSLQKYSVRLCKNLTGAAYVLEPEERRGEAPGAVAACGHGYGVRQILNISKRGKKKAFRYIDDYQKSFAVELAKRGVVVVAPEFFGFGEARLKKDLIKPFYISSCKELSLRLLPYGLTTASLRIFQVISCVDILYKRGDVDKERIGAMGISGGGLAALYACVLDERVKRIVLSGYVNSFRDSVLALRHCPDNYIPGILGAGEIYDFARALAPRELLVESGTRDALFPIKASEAAHEKLKRVYSLVGAPDKLHIDVFDGKHRVHGESSFDFLAG